jgi:hypothetical protein
MKDLKEMKRWVIIYLPGGTQNQYSTKDLGDSNIQVCEKIECDKDTVNVAYKEDGEIVGRTYVGMPYMLEMWP